MIGQLNNDNLTSSITSESIQEKIVTNNLKDSLASKELTANITENILNGELGITSITSETDHSKLKNLDYEKSGHTGFQPAGDYVEDTDYVHTDNNFTNEDKTKLDSLENFSGNAVDVIYEDNYDYGINNVQDALDTAFSGLDDLSNNYVSYSTQSKTTTQQNQARKNIGIPNSCVLYNQNQILTEMNKLVARKNIDAKKAIKNLGVVDLSQYNDDVFEFISTLTSEGEYKFVDNRDGFTWLVNVVWLGNYVVGQSYCNSEEGYEYIYYRNGYYDENTDTYSWNNWISFLTSSQGLSLFALKNHVHYRNVTIAYTIRTYLDTFTGNGDYRITSNADKELYIFTGYYYNVSVNGVIQYRRSQRYYSISEPWKIYSRFGLYNTSTKKITWNAWHVVEGVEE